MNNSNEFNGTYYVTEAFPSLKEPAPWVFVIACIYLCCFIVGICGNSSTLTLIFGFGKPKQQTPKIGHNTHDRFKVYVACLCVVDSLMLLSLPTTMVDSLIGFWIFGNMACKIHHFCSTVGRLASTLIITSLSIERYLSVVSPQKFGNRSSRTTTLVMMMLLALASVLLLPLIIFAKAESTFLFESRRGPHIVHVRIFKCVDSMPSNLLFWFTGSTFFVGYFCPIIIISFFNIKLLMQIRRHQRKISTKSIIPMKKVTAYIIIIALFYFSCWTPYWAGVVYLSYIDIFATQEVKASINKSEQAMFMLYCAHTLPYLNSAINWLLYGRLARNLTTQQSSSLMVYRNGGTETTSFTKHLMDDNTQSSWTRKQTLDDNSLFYSSAPTQTLLRSVVSNPQDSSNSIKLTNGSCHKQANDVQQTLTKYEEEIESFETL